MQGGALALGAADLLALGVLAKGGVEGAAFRFEARFDLNPNTRLLTALKAFFSSRSSSRASLWLTSPLPSFSIISQIWTRCSSAHF